jgi:LytS/YehU family sensor histidine kinase
VGAVAQSGKAEIINDTSLDERYIVDDARRHSEITVPIINHGKVIGIIDSEHSQKGFYTERHLQILTTIASLLAEKLYKMKAEQEVREREIELITLNRDLATSQLTALRAQMNPHFIFNALNSVQQYILQGNVDEANRYLSKFSRLQREILHHCDQNFITLEKEIEMLQLYLELEQLRFHDNFEYRITLADNIDSNEIRIPPMILQPFVENAIWHGLMPKAGHRSVHIDFSLHADSLLNCTIRDNGIGRQASAKLKEGQDRAILHKSKGLKLVNERLQILQQQYLEPFEASISDITDPNGTVAGTQVKLILFIGH